MVNETSPNHQKVSENRRAHRKGMTKEEYEKMRIKHSNDSSETNVWGKRYAMSRQEAHEQMWDAFPCTQQFRIPRTVGERLDLSSNAKLVYGVMLNYPRGITMYRWEIAGLCGLSVHSVGLALGDLERAGLMEIHKQWRKKGKRRAPNRFFPIQPPNRFKEKEPLAFLSNDISNFEEKIRARFDEIEPKR